MPAYVAFLIDIHDHEAFSDYATAAAPTYAPYDGSIALRGPIIDVIEGALDVQHDTRLVVIEFPTVEQARAWWNSPEYQPLIQLREPPVSHSRVFLVDGVSLGTKP
jgi:uncharacterized protein (DUF1330 family)